MSTALKGQAVLELGEGVAPAYCGRLLADLGADVTKLEVQGGDRTRRQASGLLFEALNSGKRVLLPEELPSSSPDLAAFDIIIESLPPREGLIRLPEFRSLAESGKIVASVSQYGRMGSLADKKGFALQSAAATVAYRMGYPDSTPLMLPLEAADYIGGAAAANAVLLAVLGRRLGSHGEYIDISVLEVLHTYLNRNATTNNPRGERGGHRSSRVYPYGTLPCADGYVCVVTLMKKHWDRYVDALGHPEFKNHPRYNVLEATLDGARRDELDAIQSEWLKDRTKAELFDFFQAIGVTFQPVHTPRETLSSSHLEDRGFFRDLETGDRGRLRVPGPPIRTTAPARQSPDH